MLHKEKEDANLRSASSFPFLSNELVRMPSPTLYLLNYIFCSLYEAEIKIHITPFPKNDLVHYGGRGKGVIC